VAGGAAALSSSQYKLHWFTYQELQVLKGFFPTKKKYSEGMIEISMYH
jgi:hypothetical protein